MAYTKIKPIRATLQKCIDYTINPDKTSRAAPMQSVLNYTQDERKTEQQFFVTGFRCFPKTAYRTMMRTQKEWKKGGEGHVLGYHVIQSFAPGEVTPEQAHEIGCEFVRRVLPQYEATVSTHLDREHLHNHIVFNSVSREDGRMYRDDYKGYYQGIRGQSDQICKEYGLSIIDPQQKGKAYNERKAEKEGKPTIRSQVREDVDRAIAKAVSWQTFVISMQHMGYTVRWGQNMKYATVKHRTGKRAIRLKSLGEGYSESEIRNKIEQKSKEPISRQKRAIPGNYHHTTGRYKGRFPFLPKQKITGFMALYYHYVYLFRKAKKCGHSAKRTQFLLRDDLAKFDRYVAQAQYLWENHIQTNDELEQAKQQTEVRIEHLISERTELYQKRYAPDTDQEMLRLEIQRLTEQLRQYRREVALCSAIQSDAEHLRQQVVEAQQQECEIREKRKEQKRYEQRR